MKEEYPKWIYSESGDSKIVESPEEHAAHGAGWGEHPNGPFQGLKRRPGRPPKEPVVEPDEPPRAPTIRFVASDEEEDDDRA